MRGTKNCQLEALKAPGWDVIEESAIMMRWAI